jgi:two-component system, chemotaxis family, chemotaxis protein CheY
MLKLRALVIDDSRIMRKMVMESLTKTNLAAFEYVEAEDGVDALSKFDPASVDIVFADWNMPKMSGIEFVHKVRGMKAGAETPIIMVTSEKTMGKMEIAMDKAGATGYVCKPFTVEELQRKLSRVIAGIKPRTDGPPPPAKSGGFFSRLMDSLE